MIFLLDHFDQSPCDRKQLKARAEIVTPDEP
jgi:hypothetical protein